MPACVYMADSNLVVANDIQWMANNTIYIVTARLEKAIVRRWTVNISNKRFCSVVWAANDVLGMVSNSIG